MRNKDKAVVLRGLLERARYEVLPTASIEDTVCAEVPPGRTLTVTASPSKGLEATLSLAERLVGHGYDVVPHLAARMISGSSELKEIVERLVPLGVTTVFVPAGDADPPAGSYEGSVELLEDLTTLGRPFPNVGITGYPESHPSIGDDLTIQAMWDKRHFATQVVSNLTFDAALLRTWVTRMRARGITMPLLVGLPGPVERTKLLAMATKIGVGESTRFLAKHKSTFARIAAPGGYSPEKFLEKASPVLGDPLSFVAGLHVFTFNQVAETERWRAGLVARLGGPVGAAS
ncbi:MAG: 5,10-methylenetetrahydrofolate reductase [Propionibacteriales bacterium]|nr:5,10-methylenetetrahydrofolate reductase [Propionibacteriales bacterium]